MNILKGTCLFAVLLVLVLCPLLMSAAELPTYQKYEGPLKPGVVITKENWDKYLPELQKLFTQSQFKLYSMGVMKGLVTIPIVKTTYNPLPKGLLEATRKHAGTARVGVDNQLLNWTAGIPFPEPKNALELAWNCYPELPSSRAHDDDTFYSWFGLFDGVKFEKHFTWDIFKRKYRGRTDIPPLGDMPDFIERGVNSKEAIIIHEPNEVKGFIQLRTRFWDINKADEMYAYIPAIRRVRRLTGNDLTDPLLGSDCVPDDFEVWRQKMTPRMKIRALEHRDFLVGKTYVGLENKPAYDYKKNGPCPQAEWEIRPLWVLEIMINDPDYLYSKRIVYADGVPLDQGGTYLIYYGEQYDQKGRLWKAGNYVAQAANEKGFQNINYFVYMNVQTNHYTVLDAVDGYVKNFDKAYPLKEEVFTIKNLLKKAR